MSALELKVYEIFKSKLGEDEAALIIEYFEKKADQKINEKKDIFLTKDDKVDLSGIFMWQIQFNFLLL